jgi:soluble lytic murein transglycosylase-like protein
MKTTIVLLLLASSTTALRADERRFFATDAPAAGLRQPGKIVISNKGNANTITAFHFFNDIRQALFSLRSTRTVATRAYGKVLYDSSARLDSGMPEYLSSAIHEAAQKNGVDPRLLAAVARRESAFNPAAVSPVGACGLMQLMPATAKYLGVNDVFDAKQNVHGGARYLRTLLDTFDGDLDLTLAAYNAGPGAVKRYGGVPPFAETKAYVRAVRASYERSLTVR